MSCPECRSFIAPEEPPVDGDVEDRADHGADTWTLEMFKKGRDGKEFKTMQIDYPRAE